MTEPSKHLTQELSAAYADKAMQAHAAAIGVDYERSHDTLTDMLTNLRHFAEVYGLSFADALHFSEDHHKGELP